MLISFAAINYFQLYEKQQQNSDNNKRLQIVPHPAQHHLPQKKSKQLPSIHGKRYAPPNFRHAGYRYSQIARPAFGSKQKILFFLIQHTYLV